MLDHGGAAFDPVTAIDVDEARLLADHGVVDVAADHPVETAAMRLRRQRLLELADEVDGVLDLQLGPLRQRPVGQAEGTADGVEVGVEPDRHVIGLVAQEREPACVADHEIEQVAMHHQVALAIGRHVYRVFHHVDAAEMRAVVVAQELVVVARNVHHARALARLAQELLHHVVVSLRPVPGRLQRPAVDDVAHEIDGVGFVIAQEVEQLVGLAALHAEMNVGQKQRAHQLRRVRGWFKHRGSCRKTCAGCSPCRLQFDDRPGAIWGKLPVLNQGNRFRQPRRPILFAQTLTYVEELRCATRITVPRQTRSLCSQPASHSAGSSASRSTQASGERQDRCHPAAAARSASLPYHAAANTTPISAAGQPAAAAPATQAASGTRPPVKISGTKNSAKVSRRRRAQRTWRCHTSAAVRRPSGCANGASTIRTRRPRPLTSLVAAASSAISLASAPTPPAASRMSRRHSMHLPWAKPMPAASARDCQRAWYVLRNAHSSSAKNPCGAHPMGGEQTRPVSGRQAANRCATASRRMSTLLSAMTTQSWRAAVQPFTMLFNFGLVLMRSFPTRSRAGTSGCAAMSWRSSGTAGSLGCATQNRTSYSGWSRRKDDPSACSEKFSTPQTGRMIDTPAASSAARRRTPALRTRAMATTMPARCRRLSTAQSAPVARIKSVIVAACDPKR